MPLVKKTATRINIVINTTWNSLGYIVVCQPGVILVAKSEVSRLTTIKTTIMVSIPETSVKYFFIAEDLS